MSFERVEIGDAVLYRGGCLEVLPTLPENSVDSIVCDPPYGLGFMGKKWDYDVPKVEVWKEAMRVLKPGGHALIACGTRTQHRMAVNIEDAGFEIRDLIAWVYSTGFPKSLNIGKAVDKMQGNEREDLGDLKPAGFKTAASGYTDTKAWSGKSSKGTSPHEGWGTALKPAMELWTLCRKPLSESTIAANVLKWGTGGINIDGCRVEYQDDSDKDSARPQGRATSKVGGLAGGQQSNRERNEFQVVQQGRFPANLIHDGSDEVVGMFPNTKGGTAVRHNSGGKTFGGDNPKPPMEDIGYGDSGSAARFFYCAKASKSDRNEGLDGFEAKFSPTMGNGIGGKEHDPETATRKANHHPTVKPTELMRYLCRLVTPPGGVVLDLFMGSGSTGKAAMLEGFRFVGVELEAEYMKIAQARIGHAKRDTSQATKQTMLFEPKQPKQEVMAL